jgi:hypothetical protein
LALKILQGGIRMSYQYNTATTSALVAGMGVIPISGSIAIPTSTSGTCPIGLTFDVAADTGTTLSETGGGGGSTTLMHSTGSTNANVTIVGGNFIGTTSLFTGLTSASTGVRLTVNTSGELAAAAATGEYIVGEVLEYISSTEIKFIWFSSGARYTA